MEIENKCSKTLEFYLLKPNYERENYRESPQALCVCLCALGLDKKFHRVRSGKEEKHMTERSEHHLPEPGMFLDLHQIHFID